MFYPFDIVELVPPLALLDRPWEKSLLFFDLCIFPFIRSRPSHRSHLVAVKAFSSYVVILQLFRCSPPVAGDALMVRADRPLPIRVDP